MIALTGLLYALFFTHQSTLLQQQWCFVFHCSLLLASFCFWDYCLCSNFLWVQMSASILAFFFQINNLICERLFLQVNGLLLFSIYPHSNSIYLWLPRLMVIALSWSLYCIYAPSGSDMVSNEMTSSDSPQIFLCWWKIPLFPQTALSKWVDKQILH